MYKQSRGYDCIHIMHNVCREFERHTSLAQELGPFLAEKLQVIMLMCDMGGVNIPHILLSTHRTASTATDYC